MVRWDLINRIAAQIGARHYLEIGVQAGHTFRRIDIEHRTGVDPDPRSAATIHLPSDTYFERLDASPPEHTFDIIFVDGLHHREQVVRDVNNSLRYLSPGGVIVVHDCDPPTEQSGRKAMCAGVWCGDVWRGWIDLRRRLDREMFVIDTDLGCGVILEGASSPVPPGMADPDWPTFAADRDGWLRRIDVDIALDRIGYLPRLDAQDSSSVELAVEGNELAMEGNELASPPNELAMEGGLDA